MNQIKIGKFIAECRKKKDMTQSQLAGKLNITDKAVSKWETGKSIPDVSLFSDLCSILEISLNELFAGEYIDDANIKQKSDEVLLAVLMSKRNHFSFQFITSVLLGGSIGLIIFPSQVQLNTLSSVAIRIFGIFLFIVTTYVRIKKDETRFFS
ncbi:MAG: helix-turn-helix transcriptional regulator [Tissierellia bacterium]|nr:helix-turn-helix transcriptional regulator [Tissierellia bacterium]